MVKLIETILKSCIHFLNEMSDNLIPNRIKIIKFKDMKWGKIGKK